MSSTLPTPRLVGLAGSREGEVLEIDSDLTTLGRLSSNHIQLAHASVSRSHCELARTETGLWLRDTESLTGTFVNGVSVRQRQLKHGDLIKLGDALFRFLVDPEEEDSGAELGGVPNVEAATTFELPARQGEADEHRSHAQLAALLAISRSLQEAQGSRDLARNLVDQMLSVLPARRVCVLAGEESELERLHDSCQEPDLPANRISRTLCRRGMSERLALVSNDVAGDPELGELASLDGSGVVAILCVPLIAGDRVLGALYADAVGPGPTFDPSHLELALAAAGIAALALDRARDRKRIEAENRRLRSSELDHDIVGESPALERALSQMARVASSDLTVLLLGESGTGKELFAKAIHRNSPRAEEVFVAINCASLSETLLESELFGHEKGAFTGAVGRKIGQLELAHRGTLFLDEVGEIPVGLQARLLRALESREIQRVGGLRTISVDVRIVAATNRDLEQAVRDGEFREDLFHRLNVFTQRLPPLRDREGDILLLANHFIARSARRLHRPVRGLAPEARAAVATYPWPGNVRELRNAMERAVVLATDDLLHLEDLPESVVERATPESSDTQGGYHQAVTRSKRKILLEALRAADGNYSVAAKNLGLNRTYLHRLLSNLDLRSDLDG